MIGDTIGQKYKLLRLLGQGGMGVVYEAQHTITLRRVALKIIKAEKVAPQSEAASRFRREARAAAAINSPHIVQVLDSGVDEATSSLYLVMEYLEGEDLQHVLDRIGPLPPDVALRVIGQALSGLAKAHDAGIIHRDIKPANLFLAQIGDGEITVKLLDFGIAKVQSEGLHAPHTSGLTDTGGFLGSPLYMSPEQVQDSKAVDPRADVWSLGCAFYAALAGSAPHQRIESVGRLILAICGSPAMPLRERAPWVPAEIAELVHHALEIDPSRRLQSSAAMLQALKQLAPGGFALRSEALVGLAPEQRDAAARAATAPLQLGPIVIKVAGSQSVLIDGATTPLGSTSTASEPPPEPPKPARKARSRLLVPAGVALAIGGVATAIYQLSHMVTPMESALSPSAQPAALDVSAAQPAALTSAEPRASGAANASARDASAEPPRSSAAPSTTAAMQSTTSRPMRAPGSATQSSRLPAPTALLQAPPPLPQRKPEDSLMPAEPPP